MNRKKSTQERTEQLFLFWSLYALDQTLSMTFDRRPSFQASDAQSMPVPDCETLQQYAPHLNRDTPSTTSQSRKENSEGAETLNTKYEDIMQTFGAQTFLREVQLSKIIARVHADLYNKSTHSTSKDEMMYVADALCTDLDLWHQQVDQTRTTCTKVFAQFEPNHAQQEVLMGIAYLSFLYHHYTVVIQRAASHDQPKCLKSARQALSLLQEISPDPESVYNGVSWQLLYLLFTSFFIIFGVIMSRPGSEESRSDLKRLYENVEYYKRIGGQYDTSKSGKLASSFAKIAEEAVQKAGKTAHKLGGAATFDIPSLVPPANYIHVATDVAYSSRNPSPAAPYPSTMDDTEQGDISFLQHLNWPQDPGFEWEGLAMGDCASMSNHPSRTADENQYSFDPAMMDDFMTWTGEQAKQQPLDMSFDWSSWDNQ